MEKFSHESRHITTLYNYVVISCYVLYILSVPNAFQPSLPGRRRFFLFPSKFVPGYYRNVPTGTEALFLISRHFVPGYYRNVPTGTEALFSCFPAPFVSGYYRNIPAGTEASSSIIHPAINCWPLSLGPLLLRPAAASLISVSQLFMTERSGRP